MRLLTPETDLAAYTFNKHKLRHHFCRHCGIALHSEGIHPPDSDMAAVKVRCLEGVEPATLTVVSYDGRSR